MIVVFQGRRPLDTARPRRSLGYAKHGMSAESAAYFPLALLGVRLLSCLIGKPKPIVSVGTTLANLLVHIIFSTKNCEPFIHHDTEAELHAYIAMVSRAKGAFALKVGGVEDRIHILLNLPRTITVSKLVEEIKASSSKWIKNKGPPI